MRRSLRVAIVISMLIGGRTAHAAAQSNAVVTPQDTTGTSDNDELLNPDRPGIADGSRVIRAGQVQIELGAQREYHVAGDAHSRVDLLPILLRAGISERVEIRVESNAATRSRGTEADGSTTDVSGFAPASVGLKTQLFDSGGDHRRSLGMIVRVFPPSGSGEFRSRRYAGDLRVAGDWDFASHMSVNPNLGVARADDGRGGSYSTLLGALTLNYLPTPRLNPFIDLGYQSRESSGGGASVILDSGIAYIVGSSLQLDVSAGRGVHGSTPPRPFVAAGVSVRTNAF